MIALLPKKEPGLFDKALSGPGLQTMGDDP